MTHLFDINVLMAIAWKEHVHHEIVLQWLKAKRSKGRLSIATCPLTQLGFVRISMNIKAYAADFESAIKVLTLMLDRDEFKHEFWPDGLSLISIHHSARSTLGSNQLTDFYLANLAKSHGGRLVTLDRGIKDESVELISAGS